MSNYYAPCFYRIDLVVIPSYIVLPWENGDIFATYLHCSFNTSVTNSEFTSVLKQASITPLFKKGEKYSKGNYRPVSILPNVSKIIERCMFFQINSYMDVFLSRHWCGFRKGYCTQQCLPAILEKWNSTVDNKKSFGTLLTVLSKSFDCLSHEFLLAKLPAYGFNILALRLVYSYLKNKKRRTEINSAYRSWEEITFGVLPGSTLRPLLFNIFLYDLFYIMSDTGFASYADNNTPYVSDDTIDEVIKRLQTASVKLFKWFA